jgi:hypothetical protein
MKGKLRQKNIFLTMNWAALQTLDYLQSKKFNFADGMWYSKGKTSRVMQ